MVRYCHPTAQFEPVVCNDYPSSMVKGNDDRHGQNVQVCEMAYAVNKQKLPKIIEQ